MLEFVFQFLLLNKAKKYEIVLIVIEIIIASVISYRIANVFGWFYYKFDFTIDSLIQFISTGTILVVISFGIMGFLIVDHAIDLFAYTFTTKLKNLESHLDDLLFQNILERNPVGEYISSKEFQIYSEILGNKDDTRDVIRFLKLFLSITFFLVFGLFSYNFISIITASILFLVWIYFFYNYVHITRQLKEMLKYESHIKDLLKNGRLAENRD